MSLIRSAQIRRLVVAVGISSASCLLSVGTANATSRDADEPKPSLSLANEKDLQLALKPSDGDLLSGQLRVTVFNSGTVPATPNFRLIAGRETDCAFSLTNAKAHGFLTRGKPLLPTKTRSYSLHADAPQDCVGVPAELIMRGATTDAIPAPVTTSAVTVTRKLEQHEYLVPLLLAVLAGIVFAAAALWFTRTRWTRRTPSGPSWTFAGSWLTSFSTVSTALAGVLTASGFTAELLPGIPLGHFLGLGLLFAALVGSAPMVFSSLQKNDKVRIPNSSAPPDPAIIVVDAADPKSQEASSILTAFKEELAKERATDPDIVWTPKGTLYGVVIAGSLTLAGVAGQIFTLWVLSGVSSAAGTSVWVVRGTLISTAVAVIAYAATSVNQACRLSTDPPTPERRADPPSLDFHSLNVLGSNQQFTGTF